MWAKKVVAGAIMMMALLFLGEAAGAADGDGLSESNSVVYSVSGSQVTVTETITLTNVLRNQRQGNVITQFYFNGYSFAIPSDALVVDVEGATVTSDNRNPDDGVRVIEVSFPNLFNGRTRTITVTYNLLDPGPRSGSVNTINPAYTAFPVWAAGDSGQVDIRIEFPLNRWHEVFGDVEFVSSINEDGRRVLEVTDIDPLEFSAYVTFRDDTQLADVEYEVDGAQFVIRSWPRDGEWRRFVIDTLDDKLPILMDLIGEDWPEDRPVEIIESSGLYLHGLAGFYDSDFAVIEVGDALDEHTLLHEIAHVWINRSVFDDRWLIEGLVEELANRTIEAAGGDLRRPDAVSEYFIGREPLLVWQHPQLGDDLDETLWFYNASWWVMHRITKEIGTDGLSAMVSAALSNEAPYTDVEGTTISTGGVSDWKMFLDLAEEVGGSTTVEGELTEWILPDRPSYTTSLGERSDARESLDVFEETLGDWRTPEPIHEAMSLWKFDDAIALMDSAGVAIDERNTLDERASAMGLAAPDGLGDEFATSDDFSPLSEVYLERDGSLDTIERIEIAALAERDWQTRFGLWREIDPIEEIDIARAAFEADDADAVVAAEERLRRRLADAADEGERRAYIAGGAAGGLLVLLILVVVLLVRRRRRKRRRAAELEAATHLAEQADIDEADIDEADIEPVSPTTDL